MDYPLYVGFIRRYPGKLYVTENGWSENFDDAKRFTSFREFLAFTDSITYEGRPVADEIENETTSR